jgi:hypothetical protein
MSEKLKVKKEHERCERNLAEYEKHDSPELPAWTLLLPNVVKAYGVCPHLNINDPAHLSNRRAWVESQPDGGATYRAEVDALTLAENNEASCEQRKELLDRLTAVVEGKLATTSTPISCAELLEKVRDVVEGRSKTKAEKAEALAACVRLSAIANEAGIDIARYAELIMGCKWKVRPPMPPVDKQDPAFTSALVDLDRHRISVSQQISGSNRQRQAAYRSLAGLIDNHFQIQQRGRWLKRWFALTPEQQKDRISSYCAHYAQGLSRPSLGPRMTDWVTSCLADRSLRPSDIQWCSKTGIIQGIACAFDPAADQFVLPERNAKSSQAKKKRHSEPAAFPSANASTQDKVDPGTLNRANRLLLVCILSYPDASKALVVQQVMDGLRRDDTPLRNLLRDSYERMVAVIERHPMPPRL